MMAIGARAGLPLHGLSVPEDCSVIGYDDVDLAVHASPLLATIHAD
jgi:DNA-binding LacI/PurR family transcriptional regulator